MLKEKYAEEIAGILQRFPNKKSAVLPLMHLAQNEYGHMSREAMVEVAAICDLDPTHVLSLSGFYTLFNEDEVGTYVLEVCNDLACALRGADEFLEKASNKLDCPVEGTSPDGMFTLKGVMCLAACDRAPMLQCNLKYHEHLNEEKFDALVEEWRETAVSGKKESSVVEKITAYASK